MVGAGLFRVFNEGFAGHSRGFRGVIAGIPAWLGGPYAGWFLEACSSLAGRTAGEGFEHAGGEMRSIPVDMTRVPVVIAMGPAEPVTDQDGVQRKNQDKQLLFSVPVAVTVDDGNASVIRVRVAGEVPPVTAGMAVRLVDLVAAPWEIGGRHGLSYRARAVVPGGGAVGPSGPARSGPTGPAGAGPGSPGRSS